MHIKKVSFQNFRNFANLELNLDQGFIILAGPNGAGKTNFLEGLYWGAMLKRFPGTKLSQLVRDGQDFYKTNLLFHLQEEENLGLICERAEDKYKFSYKHNNLAVPRTKYTNHLPMISFLPEDLNLLGHSPSGRRRFLNEALSAVSPEYRHVLAQYEKTLRQRNEALQTGSELEIWNEQLSEFGSEINKFRAEFLAFADFKLGEALKSLSPDLANTKAEYRMSGALTKEAFHQKLLTSHAREQEILTTAVGPHRDDFEVFDNNHTIVGYLSRGQLRSVILALKILEQEYVKDKLSAQPVMLLDDVFSEFDEHHQRALIKFLKTFDQVFMTTAHLKEVQDFLPQNSQLFTVKDGMISPFFASPSSPLVGEE